MWQMVNDITITLYLYVMIYMNCIQAKPQPSGANRKGPVISNNIIPRCNVPSRKKI